MATLWLHLKAPFAAFRPLQAGVYRSTAPMMPYSAALGLVLNLAGVEMRAAGDEPVTLISPDVPRLRIALGLPGGASPGTATLYQQLHGYPVGAAGKENRARTFGAKYWIAPARRELLVDFEAVVGVEAEEGLLADARRGLRGELQRPRYGLPFAGDNSFLFDRIDVLGSPPRTRWYTPLSPGDAPRPGSCRLTVGIDRADNSRTSSLLVAPEEDSDLPPEQAWVWTPTRPQAG